MTSEVIEQPALLVRLGGLVYQLPRETALALIERRLASPVASLDSFPDVVLTDDELVDARLDWAAIQSS